MDEDKEEVRNMASAAEQRLFKRLNWLMLLLGILVGIFIVVIGVALHDFDPTFRRAARLASPMTDERLVPLTWILFGAIVIVEWWRRRLRTQLEAIWHPAANKKTSLSLYHVVNGVCLICYGVFLLVVIALNYEFSFDTVLLLVGGWLGAILWAWWYMWRRE